MRVTGKTKFKTLLFSFFISKNGGQTEIEIKGEVPPEYLKPGEPDKKKIKEVLKAGTRLEFAEFKERGESLKIR